MERKNKISTEMEKIDIKIAEIDKKLKEMREAEEQANKREQKKKKVAAENKLKRERLKNQWVIMACLTNFIEKNKVNWERRGILQEKEKTKVDDLESKEITAEELPPPTPPSNNHSSPKEYWMQRLDSHSSSVDWCPANKPTP